MDREEMRRIQRLPTNTGRFSPISRAGGRGFNRDNLVQIAAENIRATRNALHPSLAPLTAAEKARALQLAATAPRRAPSILSRGRSS